MTSTNDDLLGLARKAATSQEARWRVAGHPKIRSIIEREVRKYAPSENDKEDLESEAALAVVQALGEDLAFGSEAEVVAYWDRRIRGLVQAGLRYAGGHTFCQGRLVRRMFPAGSDVLGDRYEKSDDDPNLLSFLFGPPTRHRGMERTLEEHRQQEHDRERRRLVEMAREFLFGYRLRQAADCFWYRVQGMAWKEIPELVGFPSGTRGRELARIYHHRFTADAKTFFIERGERVTVDILGIHVDEMEISAVLLRGGEVRATWQEEYSGVPDRDEIERGLRKMFNRGASLVVTNRLVPCDLSVLVKAMCVRRLMDFEEFDLELLLRGLRSGVIERLDGMNGGLRRAFVLARAKAIECELKMERL